MIYIPQLTKQTTNYFPQLTNHNSNYFPSAFPFWGWASAHGVKCILLIASIKCTVFPLDLSPVSTIQLFARVVETVGASRSRPDLLVVVGIHSAILFCNSQFVMFSIFPSLHYHALYKNDWLSNPRFFHTISKSVCNLIVAAHVRSQTVQGTDAIAISYLTCILFFLFVFSHILMLK